MKKLVAGLLLGVSLSASAQYTTMGAGNCAQWVGPSQYEVHNKAWIMGFLTGVNFMGTGITKAPDILENTTPEQIYLWMSNYCKANPLSNPAEGGNKLAFELLDAAVKLHRKH